MKIRLFRPEDLEQLIRFWKELQSNSIVAGNFCIPTEENVARWQRYVITIHEADKNQILARARTATGF